VQQELPEVEFSARLHEFFRAIDRAAARVFQAQAEGRQDLAVDIFRRNIEYRLANDFEALVEGARQEERGEVAQELNRVQSAQHALLVAAAICSILVVGAGVGSGLALRRSIVEPVRQLTAGAQAIAQGRLDHRITTCRRDEFQLLSDSFNKMAEAVGEHQGRLVSSQARLESEVEQRTHELREANEQLRAVDSRRNQFLTDAGHELRTPLTILRGEAEVALRGRPRLAAYREALARIRAYAADMGRLLEDLQAFTRAQAEDVSFTFEIVEPAAVASAAIQECALLADPKQLAIELVEAGPGRLIRADSQRLKQALLIGIDNAIKYADPGGIIEIGIRDEIRSVAISISDHGCGIDPGELPFVFDRYYRGENNASRAANGMGVGLSIAKAIVERHGGDIALEATEPRGAVLRIRLPVAEGMIDAHPDH
jgi:two-component system OmpR family sensor kinase